MDVLYDRCAGIDLHQAELAVCVRVHKPNMPVRAHAARFETTPQGLDALVAFLRRHEITQVAMEGTGVYWLPIFAKLEAAQFELTLCNAHHVKNVPGRKTDQSDAAWLAQLLAGGLLRKSFVPSAEVRAVRDLCRARVHRVEDRARIVNELHRLLEADGIKLCSVVSDLQGRSARNILQALADGITDAAALAKLAVGSLRTKKALLQQVLTPKLSRNTALLLRQALRRLTEIDTTIAELESALLEQTTSWQGSLRQLQSVPGIDQTAALSILAELGPTMQGFDDPHRLAAWAGLAPGQRESAGKRKKSGTREGNAYVRRILVQCAMALSRVKKPNDLTSFFRKKMPVLGYKKAAVATAHKLLKRLWTLLKKGEDYKPLPSPPLSERQRNRRAQRAIDTLKELGLDVQIVQHAA